MRRVVPWVAAVAALLVPAGASAFCGFYVGGAESSLYNDATMVVMLRDGTRTVLSMQNSYQGPPERFAMVVPVPTVLSEDDVQTLPTEVFDRVDRLAAPRLVEYWEQDPCRPMVMERRTRGRSGAGALRSARPSSRSRRDLGVTVEAQFAVGEYEIVILSADDSSGLDTWLRQEGYHIPAGAERALRPYVAAGTKFFVARVDPARVTFQNGRAMLSPLRVHYDSDDFRLPVRLGLINSRGTQDLIVHILARNQRYEVANYPNVMVPTNLEVRPRARGEFGTFYASLFDRTLERNPGAVVTEYAWQAGSCDPCPGPVLSPNDIATLGGDVVGAARGPAARGPRGRRRVSRGLSSQWTLTRLHYRYGTNGLDEDLVFRAAPPVLGGRGTPDAHGRFDREVSQGVSNNFQGRYAVLHRWRGPVACENPRRGIWGGPPNGSAPSARAAQNLATQPRRGVRLARYVRRLPPELRPRRRRGGARKSGPLAQMQPAPPPPEPVTSAAALSACAVSPAGRGAFALGLFGLIALAWRARRR